MAQTTQIVPKFSFPYVEPVVNDYTEVTDPVIADTVDTAMKQVYVVTSSKGIDNVWVKKSSRESAVKTFGESNFSKFGQPLMQALDVLNYDDTEAYIMRVMPENATYANAVVSACYKADPTTTTASERKFRIKLESTSFEEVSDIDTYKAKLDVNNGKVDSDGFTQINFMAERSSGRGTCGNTFSTRISQASTYEKEYGIKIYDFEIMNFENGLVKDYDYVGSMITSLKYNESTVTQINDLLADAEIGLPPVDVFVREDRIAVVYEQYVAYLKALHNDLELEYETKVNSYNIPEDQMNGYVKLEDQYVSKFNELKTIESLIENTEDENIPDLDEFDIIYGKKVGSDESLPGIVYVTELNSDVDTTAPDYDASLYTNDTNIIDFSSAKGLVLANGTNGYFDTPRTGKSYEDEVEECFIAAFSGDYDKKILSAKRMPLTVIFDANYPFSVKQVIAELALTRNDAPVRFDANIIESLSSATVQSLISQYASFNDKLESIDIQNYELREPSTRKHVRVTMNYFLAQRYCYHFNNNGFHIPFVKSVTQLTGHIRDSVKPVIEEFNTEIKTLLYDNRFNYFECVRENIFQRAVQNTRQTKTTDLLEENNVMTLCMLKKEVELDLQDQIYNFADSSVRTNFVSYENAKYSNWNASIVQSIEFSFATSEYEFEHSILHLYVAVIFRGLTKRVLVEIDINKRTYTSEMAEEITG